MTQEQLKELAKKSSENIEKELRDAKIITRFADEGRKVNAELKQAVKTMSSLDFQKFAIEKRIYLCEIALETCKEENKKYYENQIKVAKDMLKNL